MNMGYYQAWSKMAGLLANFFFCVFMDWDEVKVHKIAENERGQ